jgi:tRNA(Ile)-lysidine synthase
VSRSQVPDLATQFAHTVDGLCANFVWRSENSTATAGQGGGAHIAIALSGGLDSTVLLHLAARHVLRQPAERRLVLHAFHVHHGLSAHADAWDAHCRAACAEAGAVYDSRRVQVPKEGQGVEASARQRRYAALGEMCRAHHVPLLLTAHHQDDQAETVLLQLLRGAGPAGLGGMDAFNRAPGLLGDPDLVIARPLLEASRAELERYARHHGLRWVEDESNADNRYARNALRNEVMPALARHFPGFQARVARSAGHARSAQQLLEALAERDLEACLADQPDHAALRSAGLIDAGAKHGGDVADDAVASKGVQGLHIVTLQALPRERQQNAVRHWFALRGVRMPSAAWLDELLDQALSARVGAQLLITHPDCHVRRHRGRLYITPRLAPLPGTLANEEDEDGEHAGISFRWSGEASVAFADLGGVLHFERADMGLDPDWLSGQALTIGLRRGGERLRLAPNRPSRSLKQHYQALNVPAWERERAPLVWAGAQLLFAGGIGMDAERCTAAGGLILRWEVVQA